jgi:hypothetical protein
MDHGAFEQLFQNQIAALVAFADESEAVSPTVVGRRVIQPLEGARQNGGIDQFLAIIDGHGFPLYPFDVGFVDPSSNPTTYSEITELKNPVWFPYDGETKFKTEFREAPRVFVCIQPGFSQEYFAHHKTEQWNPRYWTLSRVVHQLQLALREPTYQLPNRERL